MTRLYLGVDTSNYTTSVSCVSDEGIVFERRTVLSVPLGERGLRQSEALFQHIRNLPPLMEGMLSSIDRSAVAAVAVSAKPTVAQESYMPVFLAGRLAAGAAASSLGVPLYETTHQAGHIRAALMGQEEVFTGKTFLTLHLSGGTTDLLLISNENGRDWRIERIGTGLDLHAGQLVDRVGVAMGLAFPSGASFEQLARQAKGLLTDAAFQCKRDGLLLFRPGDAVPPVAGVGRGKKRGHLCRLRLHGADVL